MFDDFHPVLQQLQLFGCAMRLGQLDPQRYLQASTCALRLHMRCDRVSVWSLTGDGEAQVATCLTLSQRGDGRGAEPVLPSVQQHRAYFSRLIEQGYIASADTRVDPTLHAVRQRYLEPGAPRALLDVAFTVNGHVFGILCCEELHVTRDWTPEELTLVRRVGTRLAREVKAEEARLQSQRDAESPVHPLRRGLAQYQPA